MMKQVEHSLNLFKSNKSENNLSSFSFSFFLRNSTFAKQHNNTKMTYFTTWFFGGREHALGLENASIFKMHSLLLRLEMQEQHR